MEASTAFSTILVEIDDLSDNLTTEVGAAIAPSLPFSRIELLFISTAFALISVCGTVGNALVVLAVILSPRLHTITNVFVVSLSVNDFISCILVSFNAVTLLGGRVLPDWFCQVVGGTICSAIGISVLTLVTIAINRWCLITKPRHVYASIYSRKNVAAMIVFVWAYGGFLYACLPYFGPGEIGYTNWPSICSFRSDGTLADSYSLVATTTTLLPGFVIILACYIAIWSFIRSHHRQLLSIGSEAPQKSDGKTDLQKSSNSVSLESGHNATSVSAITCEESASKYQAAETMRVKINRREIEVTKNLFLIVCAFFCCVLPCTIAMCINWRHKGLLYAGIPLTMNGCVNPFLYALKHPQYKAAFKAIASCNIAQLKK